MKTRSHSLSASVARGIAILFAATLLLSQTARAQGPAYLVKDINTNTRGANPQMLTDVNGTLYFVADDGRAGPQLWRSDGTTAGTVRVMAPESPGTSGPVNLTNVNGTLFFVTYDGADAVLWRSDGTNTGTVLVTQFPGLAAGGGPGNLTAVHDMLFFTAVSDEQTGTASLWRSDGTEAGTFVLTDVSSSAWTAVGRTLFFLADVVESDGTAVREIWRSDGTAAGTGRVSDLSGTSPVQMTNVSGMLFFLTLDASRHLALWRSDGTAAGTTPISELPALSGTLDFYSFEAAAVGGELFFSVSFQPPPGGSYAAELWRSDGTPNGTLPLLEVQGATTFVGNLTAVGSTLFFSARDHADGSSELWRSDGTAAGTQRVKSVAGQDLTGVNGTVLFISGDGTQNFELWRSDGTEAGTVPVKAFAHNGTGSIYDPVAVHGIVCFVADDGHTGLELWRSDGTEAGTVEVKDINAISLGSAIAELTNANGTLFFTANDLYPADSGSSRRLWRSDGTTAGTVPLTQLTPVANLAAVGRTLFFFVGGAGSDELQLWRTDGTETGTVQARAWPSSGVQAVRATDRLLFFMLSSAGNFDLWRSDGTARGTVRLSTHLNSPGFSSPYYDGFPERTLAVVGSTLFFVADDGATGRELWRTDGSVAETMLVKDIFPGAPAGDVNSSYPIDLTDVNGTLFFAADDGVSGHELWRSDGTATGTVLVKDIVPGTRGAFDQLPSLPVLPPHWLTNVSGTLFFVAFTESPEGSVSAELWRSDGTAAGTLPLPYIDPGISGNGYFPFLDLHMVGHSLFFNNGSQLWRSDGTSVGTMPIGQFTAVGSLADANGTLLFADAGVDGTSVWKSDGTPAGTAPIQRFAGTQPFESELLGFTVAGADVFFTADDGEHGQELWKLPLASLPSVCAGDCNASGSVTVDDVIPMVNIALGSAPLSSCPAGDSNHDDQITVDEILTAVRNALRGCPSAGGE